MCGRYLLYPTDIGPLFGIPDAPRAAPRYNVAPGQRAPVVTQAVNGHELRDMRWGLVPSWATDPSAGFRTINARCETVGDKPSFRSAFRHRRCLVPASGFYEWRKEGKRKQPYLLRPRHGMFAFAGLWESWSGEAPPLESFTILTTAANDLVRPLHDRMPVVMRPPDFAPGSIRPSPPRSCSVRTRQRQ